MVGRTQSIKKIGGYGYEPSVAFYELAFGRTFGKWRLAPALFGGQDFRGVSKSLSNVRNFDLDMFHRLAGPCRDLEGAFLTGGLLAAAIFSSDVEGDAIDEFQRACDGMCVCNEFRHTGLSMFLATARLATVDSCPGRLERSFAAACDISPEMFRLHAQVRIALDLGGAPAKWADHIKGVIRSLAISMLRHSQPAKFEELEPSFDVLSQARPAVKGGCLTGVDVPPALRGQVVTMLEVSLRVLGIAVSLDTAEHLSELLTSNPGLRKALAPAVWFEDDGTLREEFKPVKRGKSGKQS